MKKQIQYTDHQGNVTEFTWEEWKAFEKEQEVYKKKEAEKIRQQEQAEQEACPTCQEYKKLGFGPSHKASRNCQSGRYNHCTCDTCF